METITDTKWHYNLGYEEAREMAMEVIEAMRDSGDFDTATLDELEQRIQ